jgi:hypothetical protein
MNGYKVGTETVSTHSESLQTLTSHGGHTFETAPSKYVIHTHTIPLATVVDQQYLLDEKGSESYFHGYQAGEKADVHCPHRSCMYIKSDRSRVQERLKLNCPCGEVALNSGTMQPLCFMVYLRSLNHTLTGLKQPEGTTWNLNPSEVMFCQTASGCFDNSYPGHLRDKVKVTGWHHVTEKSIFDLMDCLYWYRKHDKQYKLTGEIRRQLLVYGLRKTKHNIMQAMHTVNSLLVKKMLSLAPEIEGYKTMAKHTAWAFSELIRQYGHGIVQTESGLVVEPEGGFYQDSKDFSSLVKSSFHREMREERLEWLSFKGYTKAFGAFFGTELRRLKAWVESEYSSSGSDYSLSPAWIYRASILSQTRGMGYLPESVAECRRIAFRNTVNRAVVPIEPEVSQLQYLAVQKRLADGGLPRDILSNERQGNPGGEEPANLIFDEVMSRIELPLKGTASVDTFVKDGGKVEDARLLLLSAREHSWQIPVRDLDTNSILEFITVQRETESDTDYSRPLFWISYQLILNHWVRLKQWREKDYYGFFFKDTGLEYSPGVMDAKIVHISEPGKERNLTKSHAVLTWFLTPASKITQGMLAFLPEHKAGLLESNHEWRHQKRVSALSDESGFIYDSATGKLHPEIRHVFKDWTESTDFISKLVGWAHLRGLMDYVGFPRAYKQLVLKTIVEPQPVVETTTRTILEDGGDINESVNWTGFIREGYMMGNPMTKTILHLVHASERQISMAFLSRKGLKFRNTFKYSLFTDQARLDREKSDHGRTQYLSGWGK